MNFLLKLWLILKSFFTTIKDHHFDWDDNVVYMPTKILYFLKDETVQGPKELRISTGFFAETRETVGLKDHVISYSIKEDNAVIDENGTETLNLAHYQYIKKDDLSFREFRDHPTENFFVKDLKEAVASKRFAPSFNDFVEALNTEKSANRTTIITARGQSPETIHAAVEYLKEIGLVKHSIPLANIYPVTYANLPPEFIGHVTDPSLAKKNVLAKMIDNLEAQAHNASVGFSDDDPKTFKVMKEFLLGQKKDGRWPNTNISLYFTGNKTKEKHSIEA